MQSNSYTFIYAVVFTALVAVVLAVVATSLAPRQAANVAQAKRKAILQSVMPVNDATLEADYDQYITEYVIDFEGNEVDGVAAFDIEVKKELKKEATDRQLPLYVYSDGSRTNYIVPLQGAGLWGPISAYLALESDLDKVYGVVFEHEKETPGLGAEITTARFQDQFKGEEIFDASGNLAAIEVLKGVNNVAAAEMHKVDGISGSTMTTNGVTRMFRSGLQNYAPYFTKKQNS